MYYFGILENAILIFNCKIKSTKMTTKPQLPKLTNANKVYTTLYDSKDKLYEI